MYMFLFKKENNPCNKLPDIVTKLIDTVTPFKKN